MRIQNRLTAHCSKNSLRNHSKSMLPEGTNGELHTVQEAEVVLSAVAVLVLIEDVESELLVDNVVEEVEDGMVVLLDELIAVVEVAVVGGVGVVVVVNVVEEDGAVVVVVLCVRLV